MSTINLVDANRIKFEARTNPPPPVPKTGSAFGRFLRGFGALVAPIGFASAPFFPFGALIGASAYGLGVYGGYRDSAKKQETIPAGPVASFPAIYPSQLPAGAQPQPTSGSADPINVILNRQATIGSMIEKVEPGEP